MQTTLVTIEEAANKFKLWRNNNPKSKSWSIPTHLKEQVRQLLESYSVTKIAKALNISKTTLYSIKKDTNSYQVSDLNSNNEPEQNLDFVPLQLLNSIDTITPKQSNYTCQIIRPNGIKLIIQAHDPKPIIKAFLCSN